MKQKPVKMKQNTGNRLTEKNLGEVEFLLKQHKYLQNHIYRFKLFKNLFFTNILFFRKKSKPVAKESDSDAQSDVAPSGSKKRKSGRVRKHVIESDDNDSNFEALSDEEEEQEEEEANSDDSEIMPKKKTRRRKASTSSEQSGSESDEKPKKRRRIKHNSGSGSAGSGKNKSF